MPGRNPQEAFDAFIAPLKDAVSVLDGHAQFVAPRKGGFRLGQEYSWLLNSPQGMPLRGVGTLHAQMWFKFVKADTSKHEGAIRVTTLGYLYRLEGLDSKDIWRAHWHPQGNSPVSVPHVHIAPHLKSHFITPRITFENVVQWCAELGAPLRCTLEEAVTRLELAQAQHVLFRSWNTRPDEPRG